jgi:hypothetical protein
MYSVEYSTAPAVPTLRGRFGTESHVGSGTAGLFVSYAIVSSAHCMRALSYKQEGRQQNGRHANDMYGNINLRRLLH